MASDMIFISYSRQDSEFVTRLTNDLKNAGFNIWVDTESLEPEPQAGKELSVKQSRTQQLLC